MGFLVQRAEKVERLIKPPVVIDRRVMPAASQENDGGPTPSSVRRRPAQQIVDLELAGKARKSTKKAVDFLLSDGIVCVANLE